MTEERQLFFQLMDLEGDEARQLFLDEIVRRDARLRNCVLELLAAHGEAAGFMMGTTASAGVEPTPVDSAASQRAEPESVKVDLA